MIFNVTYSNRHNDNCIDELVGQPFSFLQRLRKKGIGSERFVITDMSEQFDPYNAQLEDERHCNIELRPQGIVVYFSRILERFAWPIPFYQLTIYQSDRIVTVYQNTEFIKLQSQDTGKSAKNFIHKVISAKARYSDQSTFIEPS